jgi:hypothetical protein
MHEHEAISDCAFGESDARKEYLPLGTFKPNQQEKTFSLTATQIRRHFSNFYYAAETCVKRETFMIIAIRNLFKRINFLELFQQLQTGEISNKEFEKEISSNSKKYVVKIETKLAPDSVDHKIISGIVAQIGTEVRELSVSEVGDVFSVNTGDLIANVPTPQIK